VTILQDQDRRKTRPEGRSRSGDDHEQKIKRRMVVMKGSSVAEDKSRMGFEWLWRGVFFLEGFSQKI
jgi:hypothetical protein